MDYRFFLDLALILFTTKFLGIMLKKVGVPEVVGTLLAGIILGPAVTGAVEGSYTLKVLAEIGVIMIMFTAGMETDIKQIKANGITSFVVTILGVIVSLASGFLLACLFNGGFNAPKEQLLSNLFYGVILTATSVSITVAALKEMGCLSGKAGTVIVSAAILDDIIGLIVLTFVISMKDPSVNLGVVTLNTLLFFVFSAVFGIIMHILFKFLEKKYPHNRRMSIFSLVFCFLSAYIAEEVFGIADITGAFIAGVVISNIKSSRYIGSRVDISAYMVFAPVFFANIGISNKFGAFDAGLLLFGALYILTGMLAKIAGCGLGARLSKFSVKQSLFIGIGMMARAEVMLITVQKGVDNNLLSAGFIPYSLGLVIISSLLTPVILKLLYKNESVKPQLPQPAAPENIN